MNHLAKYLTMKIIPREYENDLDQIELGNLWNGRIVMQPF